MIARLTTALAIIVIAAAAQAQTEIRMALSAPLSGASAGLIMAIDNGHFAENGLNVTVTPGQSSRDAVARVALGTHPVGIVDFSTLARAVNDNATVGVIAAMIMHDRPDFAVIGLSSRGISTPADLEGHNVGHVPGDETDMRLSNFAVAASFDLKSVALKSADDTGLASMLATGQVDAIAAYAYNVLPELARLGVPANDIVTMRMADYQVDHYGDAVIVNTAFAQTKSGAVKSLLGGIVNGWRDAIADPEAAVQALILRDPTLDPAQELERLNLVIAENVLTDWVRENGMGDMHYGRIEAALAQLQEDPAYINVIERIMVFTNNYLPAEKLRALD